MNVELTLFHLDYHTNRDRYIWEGSVVDLETYVETDLEMSRAGFIPGIGCTINSIMDMHNIDSTHGSTYDTSGLHRSKDPGAGASTPYHDSLTEASEDIPAGSELFAEYGGEYHGIGPQAEHSRVGVRLFAHCVLCIFYNNRSVDC